MLRLRRIVRDKNTAMPDGLSKHKRAVDDQRNRGDEDQLAGRVIGARRRDGVIGEHQREHDNGAKRHQRRTDSVQAESLLIVLECADQQTQADDPIQNDHHGGEYRVARERRSFLAPGEHERDDERHFDQRNRQGQYQGSVGFTYAMRDDIGMMDGGEQAGRETCGNNRNEDPAVAQAKHSGCQDAAGNHRGDDGPERQIGVRR